MAIVQVTMEGLEPLGSFVIPAARQGSTCPFFGDENVGSTANSNALRGCFFPIGPGSDIPYTLPVGKVGLLVRLIGKLNVRNSIGWHGLADFGTRLFL